MVTLTFSYTTLSIPCSTKLGLSLLSALGVSCGDLSWSVTGSWLEGIRVDIVACHCFSSRVLVIERGLSATVNVVNPSYMMGKFGMFFLPSLYTYFSYTTRQGMQGDGSGPGKHSERCKMSRLYTEKGPLLPGVLIRREYTYIARD